MSVLEELLAEIEADAKEKCGADGAGIISKLRSDLRHGNKESERLSAENADLRARLEQAERERDDLLADVSRLRKENASCLAEVDRLESLNVSIVDILELYQAE